MATKGPDDLQAVRTIVETLQPFPSEDRERIIRWAREKLGMSGAGPSPSIPHPASIPSSAPPAAAPSATTPLPPAADIKTFILQKSPGSDTHFAATVAYYYQFMAPDSLRKGSIGKDDLIDACRKADRKRPATPAQVLINAYHEGILDRADKGQYKLNSVGENLVAMVLPPKGEKRSAKPPKKPNTKSSTRKRASKR